VAVGAASEGGVGQLPAASVPPDVLAVARWLFG
jgi:hypothetical protein